MKRGILATVGVFVLAVHGWAQLTLEPSEQIKALAWMDGTWAGTVSMNVQGVEFEQGGTMTISTDRRFKKIESTSSAQGLDFSEVSYIAYHPDTDRYSMHTFANWANTPRVDFGSWDGTTWQLVSEPWVIEGMGEITSRTTITRVGDDEMSFLLEFRQGIEWIEIGKGTYKRVVDEAKL